jgi:hypothetical protein
MISDAPVKATTPFQDIADKVSAFIAAAKDAARDGLTWAEFGELLTALLRLSVQTLDAVATLTGPQKKEIAVEAAGALFDTLADRCVPLLAWPLYVVVRPVVRSLVLAIAAGTIETLLPLVRAA